MNSLIPPQPTITNICSDCRHRFSIIDNIGNLLKGNIFKKECPKCGSKDIKTEIKSNKKPWVKYYMYVHKST